MSPAFIFYCTTLILSISTTIVASEGVFDKIKAGLQNAKTYLEQARDIADLVAKSLRSKQAQKKRGDEEDFVKREKKGFDTNNLVSIFFRLLGLDSKKVSAVAINSFIFFAQMISELFKITPKVEQAKSVDENRIDPIRIITESENERVQNLLKQAQDENLPNQLINNLDGYDSSCIRLLLCKTTPFILAAQKTLKNGSLNNRRDITSWLPSKETFEEYSDECDDKHNDCELDFAP